MSNLSQKRAASHALDAQLVDKLVDGLGVDQTTAAIGQEVAELMLYTVDLRNELVRLGMDPSLTYEFEHHFFTSDISTVDPFRAFLAAQGMTPGAELRAAEHKARRGFALAAVAKHSLRLHTLMNLVATLSAHAERFQHEYSGMSPCVKPTQHSTLLCRLDFADPYQAAEPVGDPASLPKLDSSCMLVNNSIAKGHGFGFTFAFPTLGDMLSFREEMDTWGNTPYASFAAVSDITGSLGMPYHIDYIVRAIPSATHLDMLTNSFSTLAEKHNGAQIQLSVGIE